MIVSNDKELRNILEKRDVGGINYFVEREFRRLMGIMLERIRQIHIMIEFIKSSIGFNIEKVLKDVDYRDIGYIDISGLTNYLKKYNKYNLNIYDAQILLNEIDIDKDGTASYDDFKKAFFIVTKNIQQTSLPNGTKTLQNDESRYQITLRSIERKNISINNINIHFDILKKFFNSVLDLEKLIEKHRIKLAQQDDIDLENILTLLNKDITFNQFMLFFKKNNIYVSDNDISLLFTRFDNDKDYKLNATELSNIFISKNEIYSIKARTCTDVILSSKSKSLIIELFRLLINNEKEINILKKKLTAQDNNIVLDYFDLIKSEHRTYITLDNFKYLLANDSSEVYLLFERFDKNKDDKITLEEVYYINYLVFN